MNTTKLIGRLAQNPEIRYTKTGKAVASFTLAVGREYAKTGDQQQQATDFIPIVAWGNLAQMCETSLKKGSRVFVEGRLQVRTYETADGQKRRVAEIVASFIALSLESEKQFTTQSAEATNPVDFSQMGREVVDEEIPF